MGSDCPRPERFTISSLRAKLAKSWQLSTFWRLYVYETLLERLPRHLEGVTPALREFIQNEPAVVRPRHLARRGDVPAADPADIRGGVMGSERGDL